MASEIKPQLPLGNTKVVEFGQGVAAPFCGMMLGDSGANVVKIEPPGTGDISRQWAPPYVGSESAYFLSMNRNKRSIVIDLKTDEGKNIATELCKDSDVVIENFRPGVLEKLGLGYDQLAKQNSKLVYCSITGYGQDGPSVGDPAFDLVIQARGGLMDITGQTDGEPVKVGVPITDIGAGMYAAYAVSLALHKREATGKGEKLDISLLDTAVSWLSYWITGRSELNKTVHRTGSAHVTIAPYQLFKAENGYVAIGASTDKLWSNLCHVLELDALIEDARFRTNPQRVKNKDELVAILNGTISKKRRDELIAKLSNAGVPCGPLQTTDEVVSDPQVRHRNMIIEFQHPELGKFLVPGSAARVSGVREKSATLLPPYLGENTEQILSELGYTASEISLLATRGIVKTRD